MTRTRMLVLPAVAAAALAAAASAYAHAELTPAVALSGEGQLFSLAVPTEKERATTTRIELTPPSGFDIDSFVAAPGWKRLVQQTGSGEEAVIEKVTWVGGHVPTDEDALFQFLATPSKSKTYTFKVRQTYSDGSVVDWTGPENSDDPAPRLESVSSFGGGGGTSTIGIVALVLSIVALVVAGVAIFTGKGDHSLT